MPPSYHAAAAGDALPVPSGTFVVQPALAVPWMPDGGPLGAKYQCGDCPLRLTSEKHLERHKAVCFRAGGRERRFFCVDANCRSQIKNPIGFTTPEALYAHYNPRKGRPRPDCGGPAALAATKAKLEGYSWRCLGCGKGGYKMANVQNHRGRAKCWDAAFMSYVSGRYEVVVEEWDYDSSEPRGPRPDLTQKQRDLYQQLRDKQAAELTRGAAPAPAANNPLQPSRGINPEQLHSHQHQPDKLHRPQQSGGFQYAQYGDQGAGYDDDDEEEEVEQETSLTAVARYHPAPSASGSHHQQQIPHRHQQHSLQTFKWGCACGARGYADKTKLEAH